MKKMLIMFVAALICGVAMASEAQALIPFQGRLTDQQGVPYSNDQYSVIFNIYDVPAGGSSLWTERHEKVGIINGMINVFLGSITPLPGKVDFAKTAYLGITIDSDHNANSYDPEMVPRQLIVTPVYAKNAGALNGADWSAILADGATDPVKGYVAGARLKDKSVTLNKLADGIIGEGFVMPAGVIMPFAGPAENIPDGWLLCNGQILSQEEHHDLFEKIGHSWTPNGCDKLTQFGVPNLTGRTLWGADATGQNKGIGSYLQAGLPNVDFGVIKSLYPYNEGVGWGMAGGAGANYSKDTYTLDMSKNNPIYGNSETVQPPAACVNFIIKD